MAGERRARMLQPMQPDFPLSGLPKSGDIGYRAIFYVNYWQLSGNPHGFYPVSLVRVSMRWISIPEMRDE